MFLSFGNAMPRFVLCLMARGSTNRLGACEL
jgi:hypothetical protein